MDLQPTIPPLAGPEAAPALDERQIDVSAVSRRARNWRLLDCSEETLQQMRSALQREIAAVEQRLLDGEQAFNLYVEGGRPLLAEQARYQIDRVTAEWEALTGRLAEIDEALLERHLRDRLAARLGSTRRLLQLDATVFVAILVAVALTTVELLLPLPARTVQTIIAVDTVIALFLLGDFFLRLAHAEDRRWYLRRYWIDLVASLPFTQFLRFGRLLRIGRFLRYLRLRRALYVLSFSFGGLDKLAETFQVSLLKRALVIAFALLFFGALSIRLLEAAYDDSLLSIQESLWWSFTTVVTGGFADLYNPATAIGRLVTVGLVLLGLTVTGVFTASLTSVLVVDDATQIQQHQQDLELRLRELGQRLDQLARETNQGLITLETVAQQLSNQPSGAAVAELLAKVLVRDFSALQASVHWLGDQEVQRLALAGREEFAPAELVMVGDGLLGRAIANLLRLPDLSAVDLEPVTELNVRAGGISVVCPLVAAGQVLGAVHLILPDSLARYYLYNRAPMALAHHAAIALYAHRGAGEPPLV
jgi:voltage-gated potassium channel